MQARTARVAPDRLTHALLYIRVSGAEHQREGLSLDFQKKATRTYVASHPGWIVAGEYCDIESGSHDDRGQYQNLLAEARSLTKSGHSVAVVVVRLDRFGRDLAEGARARKELRKLGVEQHSIKEGGRLHSNMHAGMLMVFGEHERELIIDRVTEVRRSLVEAGWPYGRVAFGYRLRPATQEEVNKGLARRLANGGAPQLFEPDPVTSGVAIEVFERVAKGASVGSVSRWLISLPGELRGGRTWPLQTTIAMLRSPTYIARPALGAENVLDREDARW